MDGAEYEWIKPPLVARDSLKRFTMSLKQIEHLLWRVELSPPKLCTNYGIFSYLKQKERKDILWFVCSHSPGISWHLSELIFPTQTSKVQHTSASSFENSIMAGKLARFDTEKADMDLGCWDLWQLGGMHVWLRFAYYVLLENSICNSKLALWRFNHTGSLVTR